MDIDDVGLDKEICFYFKAHVIQMAFIFQAGRTCFCFGQEELAFASGRKNLFLL